VTNAIVDAGYGSPSRVYEKVATHLGMTPGEYRARGQGTRISYAVDQSALGWLLMAATDRGLCFVQFGDSADALIEQLQAEYPKADISAMSDQARPQFEAWMAALAEQLRGAKVAAGLPLDLRGTAFQMKVWDYLMRIPSGEVRSYSEVAEAIGHPKAVRAVASACAANRVGVLVPCHRVIRGDGGMGGYRWGWSASAR
jgi:AraC family transcriptional regulator of adaptative response/methylated-DNA-[protein]-cysteine methyltransferase